MDRYALYAGAVGHAVTVDPTGAALYSSAPAMSVPTAQPVNGSFVTIILLVLWFLAVMRSPKKGHTFLFVLSCAIGGLAVGAIIGYVFGGPNAAGTLGALLMQFSGIAAAINRLMLYRKPKTF